MFWYGGIGIVLLGTDAVKPSMTEVMRQAGNVLTRMALRFEMTPFVGKIIVGSVAGGFALFLGYGTWSYLQDYRSAGPVPQEMRVEEAITQQSAAVDRPRWVRISSKMVPTCESMTESSSGSVSTTTHLALDESQKYGVFLEYKGNVRCEQATGGPWEGMLEPARDRYIAFWQNHGGSVPDTALPLMRMSVGRTPDHYLKEAGLTGFMALVCAAFFVYVLRVKPKGLHQQQARRATAGGLQ